LTTVKLQKDISCGVVKHQEGGLTPLHIACSSSEPKSVEIVRLLLDALADPDARAAEDNSYFSNFLVNSLLVFVV